MQNRRKKDYKNDLQTQLVYLTSSKKRDKKITRKNSHDCMS